MSKQASGRLEKRLDEWLKKFKSPAIQLVANKLSTRKHDWKAKAAQQDRDRQLRQADWKEVSQAYLKSRGLKILNDIDESWFLAEGARELLTDKDDHVSTLPAESKWLVYADSKTRAYPPTNLNELLTTHGAVGFVWVSMASTRVALRRSYRTTTSVKLHPIVTHRSHR